MQRDSLVRHGIEFIREFKPVPLALIDQHKVVQILVNLISNAKHAVKNSHGGTKRITLAISVRQTGNGDRLFFEVTDTGVGISPDRLTRIFAHGFTTKQDGHGFGLHSSANAAKELGGSLTAASDGEGKGASFILEIPFVPVTEGASCKV
jgi:two-component system, NtrC family, sensor kinase